MKLEYCTEPKLASESICSALMRKAKKLKLDFVALGVYGTLEENKNLYVPSWGGGGCVQRGAGECWVDQAVKQRQPP